MDPRGSLSRPADLDPGMKKRLPVKTLTPPLTAARLFVEGSGGPLNDEDPQIHTGPSTPSCRRIRAAMIYSAPAASRLKRSTSPCMDEARRGFTDVAAST